MCDIMKKFPCQDIFLLSTTTLIYIFFFKFNMMRIFFLELYFGF